MADRVEEYQRSRKVPRTNGSGRSRTTPTRNKRAASCMPVKLTTEEKNDRVEKLEKELNDLLGYYMQVKREKLKVELSECSSSRNKLIAALMLESELPLSELVEEIFEKLKSTGSRAVQSVETVTPASVKNIVVQIGVRIAYGVPNPEADVLEDHSEPNFWCWEPRDVKLIPYSVRAQFYVRRICRERIRERIAAVSGMISSLKKPETEQNYQLGLSEASTKLCKAYNEADIRFLVGCLEQKIRVGKDLKTIKQEEKSLLKDLDRNRKEDENMNVLLLAAQLSYENDFKRWRGDSGEGSKRDGLLPKKLPMLKQSSLEKFFKRSKPDDSFQKDQSSSKSVGCESATQSMDTTLAFGGEITLADIRKSLFSQWHDLGKSIRSNRTQGWGRRKKPKSELFKEFKLVSTTKVAHYGELTWEKHEDTIMKKHFHVKQLLQFHYSPRPAFYGIWPKKSQIVGARHPFRKEPSLNYDVCSEDEWEEVDSGESITDSEKDEGEPSASEYVIDGEFFVPDGYGYPLEDEEAVGQNEECEEFCTLLRQQKYINSLTTMALKKDRPLIISNLAHNKGLDQNDTSSSDPELMCLQILRMRPVFPLIDISDQNSLLYRCTNNTTRCV